jgi:ABC-type transport system substrate-binding protein
LAESLEWSNNNTTLTLHLRKGVKFHDGTAFNAAAVVWNFDQRVAAKVAGTDNMASYESVDENTVRINLKKFDNTWFVQLRGTLGMMISPSWVKEKGVEYADWHPVGAGPFKFGEFVEKDYVKMVRNDDYWGGKPLLDAIVYKFIADGTTAQLAFQNGEAEVISVMAGGQNLATDLGPLGYKVLTSDGGEDLMFIPSVTNSKSPLANVKVRQAVEYAINKAAIAKNVGKGYFEPAYQYAGRTQTAYTPNFQGRVYDPEKAKQLLTEAGYPTGFKTTLFAASIMAGDEMPAVQANLKAVGIDADVQIIEIGRLIEMETKGWPEGLLESPVTVNDMFGFTISRYINRPAQPNNVQGIYWDSFYRPDELEAACQAYKITPFGPEEAAKGKEVVRILFEGVSAIPLWETHGIVVMQDYVQDYRKGLPLTSGLVSWSFTNTWLSNH